MSDRKDKKEPKVDSARYDRQLRLWGVDAQVKLQSSRVCVLGATALATELLKNLILPGIGSFTIVEGRRVTEADVGHNFFLNESEVGEPLAEATCRHLLELNPNVKGDYVNELPSQVLNSRTGFLEAFSVVLCCNNSPQVALEASSRCWRAGIPFLLLRSYGMVGSVRLVLKNHTILDTKDPNVSYDLRIANPFPSLEAHANSFDMDKITNAEHAHVPFVIVLLNLLKKWRVQNARKDLPQTTAEKQDFRKMLQSARRDVHPSEENFDEAVRHIRYALTPADIPKETKKILDDDYCTKSLKEIPSMPAFFVLARAVREFVENEGHGSLPVAGEIPDMTCDTNGYLKMKKVYQEKGKEDCTVVQARVQAICSACAGAEKPSKDDVKAFCKNVHNIQYMQFTPLHAEWDSAAFLADSIASALRAPAGTYGPHNCASIYVLFASVDRFYQRHRRFPGASAADFDADEELLLAIIDDMFERWGALSLSDSVSNDFLSEMVRFGACELHTTSALIGGVGAQEVIKILTHQMVPVNNTFIWNGIHGTSATFQV